MPIPEERLPEVDENYVEDPSNEPIVDSLDESDELEFESSSAGESDDNDLDNDETSEADTASFGYGDPAD